MKRALAACLFAMAAVWSGCDCKGDGFFCTFNNAPICTPQTTSVCICDRGLAGQQTCNTNGQGYGTCECLDGGVVDAAVDSGKGGAPGTNDGSVDRQVDH